MGIYRHFPYSNFHEMNMDEIIKLMKELSEEWEATHEEWEGFKEFITEYFNNLDLSEETLDVINKMISSGQFVSLLQTASTDVINAWLTANFTNPSNPPLDSTFTLENAAARSETVGRIVTPNQNMVVIEDHTKEETNITAVQNKKAGTVTFTGSATQNISFFVYNSTDDTTPFSFTAEAGKTYTLSGCPEGGSLSAFGLDLRETLGGAIKYADYGHGVTFSPTSDELLYLHIRIASGSGNGLVFKPQIEENTMATPFVSEASKSAKDTIARGFGANADKIIDTILSNGNTVNKMVETALTYIRNNNHLSYGQETALHWYEDGTDMTAQRIYTENRTPTEIDCSTLALLVLGGVPYELSRYVINDNILGAMDYHYDPYNGNEAERRIHTGERTLTYKLAKYLYDHGIGYIVNEENIGNVKAGDLLFFNADRHDDGAWLGIDHCEVLIDTYTNLPTNYKMPTLVTANSSGGRDNAVEITNRNPAFYNGTSESHRHLVYVASLVDNKVETRNKTVYTDPHKDRVLNMPFESEAYKPVTVEFDGILNVANTHFTIYFNGTPKEVTYNIPTGAIGKKLHYRITYAPNETCETVSIIASNANSVITDCYITSGVAK